MVFFTHKKMHFMDTNWITKDELFDLYINKKLSIRKISKLKNKSQLKISKTLKILNIKIRTRSENIKKYFCDESYFEKINSHNKAQLLGFFAADGWISGPEDKNGRFEITVQKRDEDYIKWVKDELKYTGPITFGFASLRGKKFPRCRISISSYKIRKDLIELGMSERKSLTLKFPSLEKLPNEFVPSFVRGYFEGDGSIVLCGRRKVPNASVLICVTLEFGNVLKEILKNLLDINCSMILKNMYKKENLYKNAYVLSFSGNYNILKFMSWIYADYSFVMNRKLERFNQIKNLYDKNGDLIKSQEYIDNLKEKIKLGYLKNGTSGGRKSVVKAYLKFDNEKVYYVDNVNQFAKIKNMNKTPVYRMIKGVSNKYKKWTIPTSQEIELFKKEGKYEEYYYFPPKLENLV